MQLIGVPNKDNIKLRMQCTEKGIENASINLKNTYVAVSYTHLDVYKRQIMYWACNQHPE